MSLDSTLAKGVSYITDSLSLGAYCSGLEGQSVSESSSGFHEHEIIKHDFFNHKLYLLNTYQVQLDTSL